MNWEECYQNKDTPWDKAASAPEINFALREDYLTHGSVLVPGCGRGHDVRTIAGAGADEVVGADISPSAVREAIALGCPDNVRFIEADLFEMPSAFHGHFDWVWEHTCFCALPPNRRPDYVRAIHDVLRPEGKLLSLFFLDPGLDDPTQGPPFGVSKTDLDAYFSDAFTLKAEWSPRAAYPGREGREWVRLLQRR